MSRLAEKKKKDLSLVLGLFTGEMSFQAEKLRVKVKQSLDRCLPRRFSFNVALLALLKNLLSNRIFEEGSFDISME